ncbi:MAG: ABC transporter ATP-binding protein, partial [Xanthomonadales bacterium]|nr:ABC transporter ATP-binding protein [Xanthomonadales bacterium]
MSESPSIRRSLAGVFDYSQRAVGLVWQTSRPLTLGLASLTVLAGLLPAAIALVGARLVDAVVAAMGSADPDTAFSAVLGWVLLEGLLVAALAAAQRGLSLCQSLLRSSLP